MNKDTHERRLFERIFFSSEDGIIGIFSLPDPYKDTARATIMDISEDGMGITFLKKECPPFNKGERLVLKEIVNMDSISFLKDIELEIRWVLSHRSLEHIALGCRLVNLSEQAKEKLRKVIGSWSIKIRV
ncbi:PilZ domain-containing protein [Desulfonema limicola]|uniref:PilZ domain-containing protein n=1 Tax=Desulfonema limicola TaxID=45656 RepID=A0A975B3T1_9BACT|nr:PilZ domain-containing protein [Desulfonema limicola]QTA78246.1 PilZ domain-containing protein [Desulfonema limicola]